MNRLGILRTLWTSGLAAALLASGSSGYCAEPAAKEAELKQVKARIESIRRTIQADAQRRDALAGQLRHADLQIQSARERLAEVRAQRQQAEERLAELKDEQAQAERRLSEQREALAAEARVAYMAGRGEQLKMALNQDDPARLGRMLAYHRYLGQARAERITAITEQLSHLDLLAEKIAAQVQRLAAAEEEHAREVQTLADARKQRANTLAQVKSRLKSRNDQLAKLQREARALEQLVEELRRAIEDFPQLAQQPFQRARGKLPWPLRGKLLARFGELRSGGPLKWQGHVIGAARGAQVRAPFHGRVVYADWLTGLGMLVVLDHGGGFLTLYGYNEQLYRRVGDRVAPGDVLAAVGDAPGLAQPGLYFEIRSGKRPVDPSAWLSKR